MRARARYFSAESLVAPGTSAGPGSTHTLSAGMSQNAIVPGAQGDLRQHAFSIIAII